MYAYLFVVECLALINFGFGSKFDLPDEHLPYFLYEKEKLRRNECQRNAECPVIFQKNAKKCWGYENKCDFNSSYSRFHLKCPGSSNWRSGRTKEDQIRTFFEQADFGYVRERLNSMELMCEAESEVDSYLKCSDHLRYCYAKNIRFDFRHFEAAKHSNKYREDFVLQGDITGRCKLKKNTLQSRGDHKSPLQSWAAELLPFENVDDFKMDSSNCHQIFDVPTVLIKLDAGVSMYHHFCDFVNLYISQHINGSFDRNVQIVLWDTSGMPYNDVFVETWKAFTSLPLIQLKEFDGKKICFRQAMFPLLARMQFGMYYNMPLISGCEGSGLFHAFSKHILHRLNVKQNGPLPSKIRITLLTRTTKHRRILNEDEIFKALKIVGEFEVQKIDYNYKMPFLDQLEVTANTDIFMGIHGSGLTHLLFLPDWASVFEIYNCEDVGCYSDLARLRGVRYFTWEKSNKVFPEDQGNHPTLGAHAKFTNYAFDVEEFLRIANVAADHVRSHPSFLKEQENIREKMSKTKEEL